MHDTRWCATPMQVLVAALDVARSVVLGSESLTRSFAAGGLPAVVGHVSHSDAKVGSSRVSRSTTSPAQVYCERQ